MRYVATVQFDEKKNIQHQFVAFCLEVLKEGHASPCFSEYATRNSLTRGFVHFGRWRTSDVYGPMRSILFKYTEAFKGHGIILSEAIIRNGVLGRYAAVDRGTMTTVFFTDGTSSRFIQLLK